MDVVLQVAAETVDPLTQHGHLDLGRTGVGAVGLVGVDQLLLLGCIERHTCSTSIQFTTIPCGPTGKGVENSSLTPQKRLGAATFKGHNLTTTDRDANQNDIDKKSLAD